MLLKRNTFIPLCGLHLSKQYSWHILCDKFFTLQEQWCSWAYWKSFILSNYESRSEIRAAVAQSSNSISFISCLEWDWTKILLLIPHGVEVIVLSDTQIYTNGFVLHDLGSDQPQNWKGYEKLMPGLGSKFKWTEFWYSARSNSHFKPL